MQASRSHLVLIPSYNTGATVYETVAQARARWNPVWVVVDGSTDGSAALLAALPARDARFRIIRFRKNFGQTPAFSAGFAYARGRIIITSDGDLQNDPKDIPMLVATLEEGHDIVCGWRKDRQDGLVLRLIPSWIANVLIRKVTGVRVHDYGCGLKIYRTAVLKQVRIMGGMHRFIPALIASVAPTSRIDEMAVTHNARQFGQSKYGISRTFRVVLDLLSVVFFMSFRYRPGHFFGVIGLVFGAASALLFFYLFLVKFVFGEDIGTRPMLIVAVMLFVAAAQMISTGILAEILARPDGETRNYFVRNIHVRDR